MNTSARLEQYYDFDESILGSVSRAASEQNNLSFSELADRYDISDGPQHVVPTGYRHPIETVVLRPEGDFDETTARVLHLPMANPVSRSNMVRAMRLFAADSSEQLVVLGNQSGFGKAGTLSFKDSWEMMHTRDLSPAALPALAYLKDLQVSQTDQLGYSYGADKAAALSAHATEFGIDVKHGVFVEPAGIVKRSLLRLGGDFMKSNAELERYWRQSECAPLAEAREDDTTVSFVKWMIGLTRMSSVAVASCLARSGFELNVRDAMNMNVDTGMKIAIGWGEQSEITPGEVAESVADALAQDYGTDRVSKMQFKDMHHAGADDIDLHAAIMLQGLSK